jgi:hypothetical protein
MTDGPDRVSNSSRKNLSMYRLMKSEQFTLDHLTSGLVSFYRQTQVKCFGRLRAALGACEVTDNGGGSRYYLLNESGQEYYRGIWID